MCSFVEKMKKTFGIETEIERIEREAYEKEAKKQARERGRKRAKRDYKNE
jgi:hypothetical protein